jgi:outer membrane immunogenic protein
MKKVLFATTALFALSGAALAADMPVKAEHHHRPACAQFGGFYLGANAGGAYHTAHRNDDDGYFVDNSGHTTYGTSWAAGVQGGYNLQRNCTVFGVEVDWDWTSANSRFQDNPNNPNQLFTLDSRLKSFGTARTRTGIVVDDVMLYVTGGFAWARSENTYTRFNGGATELNTLTSNRWGWTAGAGTEWALATNWTLKSEVLYVQLRQQQDSFFSPNRGNNVRFTNNDSVVTARIGINYLFGGGAVHAKY